MKLEERQKGQSPCRHRIRADNSIPASNFRDITTKGYHNYEHPTFLNPVTLTRKTIKSLRWMFGISGAISVIVGLFLLFAPDKTLVVAAGILGVGLIVAAVVRVIEAIAADNIPGGWRVLSIIFALILGFAGVLMLRNLDSSAAALLLIFTFSVGFGWIFDGILALAESGLAKSQGWAIFYGIISIIAGIIVLGAPGISASTLIIFVGIALIVTGILNLVRAFNFGKDILERMDRAQSDVIDGEIIE